MVRQKGGKKWKQGADGCIFKPSVPCQGKAKIPGTISKIVPKITFDDINQAFISSYFKNVVEGKGVLIAKAVCTPEFLIENSFESNEIAAAAATTPCKKIDTKHPEKYTNFVTEPYDTDFWHVCNPGPPPPAPAPPRLDLVSSLKILRRALNGAVALVPDAGPWVVGLDFHIGNILVKEENNEQFSSLADWGRTLIIQNPTNLASIRAGFLNAAEAMMDAGLMSRPPDPVPAPYSKMDYISFLHFAGGPTQDYDQFGTAMRSAMNAILQRRSPMFTLHWFQSELAHVRVNSVFGILRSCKNHTEISTLPNLDALLSALQGARSQQSMVTILNFYINDTKVPGLGTNRYIDLATFFPPVPVPAPSPVPIPVTPQVPPHVPIPAPAPAPKRSFLNRLLGRRQGGKQTRKEKKTLKKRGKTRRRFSRHVKRATA